MGRILSIDYGKARIGLALTDPTKTIASPLKTLKTGKDHAATVDLILKEIETHDVETLLVGLPLLLSGKDSETTQIVRSFAALLEEKSGLPVILWDERLTSKEVDRVMRDASIKRKKRAAHVDTLSATLILQNYLDRTAYDHS